MRTKNTSLNCLWHAILKEKRVSFITQTLFSWTAGISDSVCYSAQHQVSYRSTRGSKGIAVAWLQHEAIPLLLSRKANTWALPPLPLTKLINLVVSIHPSIFIMLVSTQLSAKLLSFFQAWWNWSTDPDVSIYGQTGKWTANTIMSAKLL